MKSIFDTIWNFLGYRKLVCIPYIKPVFRTKTGFFVVFYAITFSIILNVLFVSLSYAGNISITDPIANKSVYIGGKYTIGLAWTGSKITDLMITAENQSNGESVTIYQDPTFVPVTSNFTLPWQVWDSLVPGSYKLLVSAQIDGQWVSFLSSSLITVNAPSLTVSSPIGGSTFYTGIRNPLNWTYTGANAGFIISYLNTVTPTVQGIILSSSATSGAPSSTSWLPLNIPEGSYKMSFCAVFAPALKKCVTPTINLKTGEIKDIKINQTTNVGSISYDNASTITWTSNPPQNESVSLINVTSSRMYSLGNITMASNQGSMSLIPKNIVTNFNATDDFKLQISSNTMSGVSSLFKINQPSAPALTFYGTPSTSVLSPQSTVPFTVTVKIKNSNYTTQPFLSSVSKTKLTLRINGNVPTKCTMNNVDYANCTLPIPDFSTSTVTMPITVVYDSGLTTDLTGARLQASIMHFGTQIAFNDSQTFTVKAPPLPDLEVSGLTILPNSPISDQDVTVSVILKNVGDDNTVIDANAAVVEIFANGNYIGALSNATPITKKGGISNEVKISQSGFKLPWHPTPPRIITTQQGQTIATTQKMFPKTGTVSLAENVNLNAKGSVINGYEKPGNNNSKSISFGLQPLEGVGDVVVSWESNYLNTDGKIIKSTGFSTTSDPWEIDVPMYTGLNNVTVRARTATGETSASFNVDYSPRDFSQNFSAGQPVFAASAQPLEIYSTSTATSGTSQKVIQTYNDVMHGTLNSGAPSNGRLSVSLKDNLTNQTTSGWVNIRSVASEDELTDPSEPSQQIRGDIDGNGSVSITDAVRVLQCAAGIPDSICTDPLAKKAADISGGINGLCDGQLTVTDGVNILRMAAELPVSLCSQDTIYNVVPVYWVDEGRTPKPQYVEKIRKMVDLVEKFYAEEMRRNGFSYRPFHIKRDNTGQPIVYMFKGKPQDMYNTVYAQIDKKHSTVLFIVDTEETVSDPRGGGLRSIDGSLAHVNAIVLDSFDLAATTDQMFCNQTEFIRPYDGESYKKGDFFSNYLGIIAHELGHAFGAEHSRGDLYHDSIMAWGFYNFGAYFSSCTDKKPPYITAGDAALFNNNLVFRDDELTTDNKAPVVTINSMSPISIINSNNITISGTITDDGGSGINLIYTFLKEGIENIDVKPITGKPNTYNYSFQYQPKNLLNPGTYEFEIFAYDGASNFSGASSSFQITSPITIQSPVEGSVLSRFNDTLLAFKNIDPQYQIYDFSVVWEDKDGPTGSSSYPMDLIVGTQSAPFNTGVIPSYIENFKLKFELISLTANPNNLYIYSKPYKLRGPIGKVEKSDCHHITGWVCDKNNKTIPMMVKFYTGQVISNQVLVGQTTANISREKAIFDQCGGNAAHGFDFQVPSANVNARWFIYGVDPIDSQTLYLLDREKKADIISQCQ